MQGRTGTRLGIYGSILPGAVRLAKIVRLSPSARRRLAWMDQYERYKNVRLVCRHFAISRSLFYKWRKRFHERDVRGLESHSCRPRRVRQPTTPLEIVDLVRRLRKTNPEYSKYKLAVILKRDYQVVLSDSTVGRIIKRYQLFYLSPIKPKGHPARRHHRLRLPSNLLTSAPGELIEADVKHLPNLGNRRYAFVATDVMTKQTVIHVATTISSKQAVIAWQKACQTFHVKPQAVLTDNGSENFGVFQKLIEDQGIPQYFARPRTPKDKPHVERMIGTLERECIQWGGIAIDLEDQQKLIDTWLKKYHSYRPHQSLDYLTPDEYYAKLQTEKVSTRL